MLQYSHTFQSQLATLSPEDQRKIVNQLTIFVEYPHDQSLSVHPLDGRLYGYMAFRVGWYYRVVFRVVDDVTYIHTIAVAGAPQSP